MEEEKQWLIASAATSGHCVTYCNIYPERRFTCRALHRCPAVINTEEARICRALSHQQAAAPDSRLVTRWHAAFVISKAVTYETAHVGRSVLFAHLLAVTERLICHCQLAGQQLVFYLEIDDGLTFCNLVMQVLG